MTFIYLIRHGQTAWNREEIFRGRTDVPLDQTGLRQAELAGEYFKGMEIHAIYSSPLARAWQTAQKIGSLYSLGVQPLEGIIDMSFGNWEGHPHDEIKKMDPETYRQWRDEPHRARLPGGESLDEVRVRAMAAVEEVIRSNSGKTCGPRLSPGCQQSAHLRHSWIRQLSFLANWAGYHRDQSHPVQEWKVYPLPFERDLPS